VLHSLGTYYMSFRLEASSSTSDDDDFGDNFADPSPATALTYFVRSIDTLKAELRSLPPLPPPPYDSWTSAPPARIPEVANRRKFVDLQGVLADCHLQSALAHRASSTAAAPSERRASLRKASDSCASCRAALEDARYTGEVEANAKQEFQGRERALMELGEVERGLEAELEALGGGAETEPFVFAPPSDAPVDIALVSPSPSPSPAPNIFGFGDVTAMVVE
jgi:hypothetical protein